MVGRRWTKHAVKTSKQSLMFDCKIYYIELIDYIQRTVQSYNVHQARSQTTPMGGAKNFLGGNIYWSLYSTNHRNHWQRHYYENVGTKQCCERSEQKFFWVVPPIVTFWVYISYKWSQKIFQMNLFLGARRQFWPHVPFPSYVTDVQYTSNKTCLDRSCVLKKWTIWPILPLCR